MDPLQFPRHGGLQHEPGSKLLIGGIMSGLHGWRLLGSSFLVMTCSLFGALYILPQKELHRSLR